MTLAVDLSFWGAARDNPATPFLPIFTPRLQRGSRLLGTRPFVDRDKIGVIGICGSGIIDIISELYRCGIVNAKGLFIREASASAGIITVWALRYRL